MRLSSRENITSSEYIINSLIILLEIKFLAKFILSYLFYSVN